MKFLILSSTWEWTNTLVLSKCMFILIAAIQNNDKYLFWSSTRCFAEFSLVIRARLLLSVQSRLPILLTVSHKCHIKPSAYIQESQHTIIVSQYNTDYNKCCPEYILTPPLKLSWPKLCIWYTCQCWWLQRFLIFQSTGRAEGQNVWSLIAH